MFKIQMFKTFLNFDIRILNLFRISDFEFRILNQPIFFEIVSYEEKTSREYQKIHQKGKGSDSPGNF